MRPGKSLVHALSGSGLLRRLDFTMWASQPFEAMIYIASARMLARHSLLMLVNLVSAPMQVLHSLIWLWTNSVSVQNKYIGSCGTS